MNYVFRYRKGMIWKRVLVMGHRYDESQDKMILYYPDGGVREVSKWKTCDAQLGKDWVLASKKMMEQQAGQSIPVKGT